MILFSFEKRRSGWPDLDLFSSAAAKVTALSNYHRSQKYYYSFVQSDDNGYKQSSSLLE